MVGPIDVKRKRCYLIDVKQKESKSVRYWADCMVLPFEHKASFLISCLQCNYVNDWQALLENIAKFVHTMYAERKIKYDMIAE